MKFRRGPSYAVYAVVAFLLVGLAGACQPVPRPFKATHSAEKDKALLALTDSGGIVVLDVNGAPEPMAHRLATEMAKVLGELNVPAATGGGNLRSHFLQGWAEVKTGAGGKANIRVVWDLFNAKGTVIGSQPSEAEVERYRWEGGDRTLLVSMVKASAPAIAALLQEPAPADRSALGQPLYVAPIPDAPGDGSRALRQAMFDALRRLGFNVVKKLERSGLVVAGKVKVGPPKAGRQAVSVSWAVRRGDGTALGNMEQNNTVLAGTLDRAWGRTARIVADNAARGMSDLLGRVPRGNKGIAAPGDG